MLREIYYSFLPYRSFLEPIFAVCVITVPCWLLFRLFRYAVSRRSVSFWREVLLLVAVMYVSGIVAVTLSPNRSSRLISEGRGGIDLRPSVASLTCSSPGLPEGSTAQAFCVHNARGNFLLFFPLGILLPLVWRRLRFGQGLLIAVGLSLGIELAQYLSSAWGSYRAADINDSILNLAGAAMGLLLVLLLRWRPANRHKLAPV
ncbi:MAG TPA: VanZ family protein [Gemmatimonadaceae bacterium]|nr:VanZ family protein [Gemmatimonadaceae bacterium]